MSSKRDIVVKRWVLREPVTSLPLGLKQPTDAELKMPFETRERVVVLTAGGELRCGCQTPDERSRGRECAHIRQVRRLLDIQDRFRIVRAEAGTGDEAPRSDPQTIPVAPPNSASKPQQETTRRKFRFKR